MWWEKLLVMTRACTSWWIISIRSSILIHYSETFSFTNHRGVFHDFRRSIMAFFEWVKVSPRERRSVRQQEPIRLLTSGYHVHGSKISGRTICTVERWEKSMGYCFLPECNHAQDCHVNFSLLFCQMDHGLLRSRHFGTVTTWRNDFSSLFSKGESPSDEVVLSFSRQYS